MSDTPRTKAVVKDAIRKAKHLFGQSNPLPMGADAALEAIAVAAQLETPKGMVLVPKDALLGMTYVLQLLSDDHASSDTEREWLRQALAALDSCAASTSTKKEIK